MILCTEDPGRPDRFIADINAHRNPLLSWLMHSHSRIVSHFSAKKFAGLALTEQEIKLAQRSFDATEEIARRYAADTAAWWSPDLLKGERFE